MISTPTPFDWQGPPPTCEGPVGDWSAFSEFEISQVDGGYPLVIGEIFGVSFTGGLYKPEIVSQSDCPTIAHVRVGTLPYETGNPFNGSILVLTNVGAHMVTVPPVPPLTPEEKQAHERFVSRWQSRFCNVFDLELLSSGGQMAVRWLVDEAADEVRGRSRATAACGWSGPSASMPRRPSSSMTPRTPSTPVTPTAAPSPRRSASRAARPASTSSTTATSCSSRCAAPTGSARSRGRAAPRVGGPAPVARGGEEPPGGAGDGPPRLGAALGARARGRPRRRRRSRRPEHRGKLAAGRRTAWTPPLRPAQLAPEELQARAERAEYRRGREPVRYRDRAWTDGLAFAGGGLWARLDDDRQTVRTYKVVDTLVL